METKVCKKCGKETYFDICEHCGEESSEIDPTTGWCIDCIEEDRFYRETMRGL